MKLRVAFSVCSLFVLTAACAAPTSEPEVGTGDSELRALKANEVIGFLNYGESKTFSYVSAPMYRAYKLRANAYDTITLTATALTPDRELEVFLTDTKFQEQKTRTTPAAGSTKVAFTASERFADYYVIVREKNFQKTDVTIELASNGVHTQVDPVDLVPGKYGSYQPPTGLVGDVDVAMECAGRQFFTEADPKPYTDKGVISLSFASGDVTVTGTDSAVSALQGVTLGSTAAFTNGIEKSGKNPSNGTRHVLQITNIDSTHARVEYSIVWIGGNTGTPAREMSCVGIATP